MSTELVRAALARRQAGKLDEAAALLERAAAADRSLLPALGAIQFERGNARLGEGDIDAAAVAFGQATAFLVDDPASAFNLGVAEERRGRRAEAEAAYRVALSRDPLLASAWNNLLLLAKAAGRIPDAVRAGRAALRAAPAFYEALVNLGELQAVLGQTGEARHLLGRASATVSMPWAALSGLGLAEALAGRIEAALAALHKSLALNPSGRGTWNNLATAVPELADVMEALGRTLALAPDDAAAHSNLIFALAYVPEADGGRRLGEAMSWGARHASPRPPPTFANPRDSDRRLRVGYLSGDLRQHPIAYNVEDLLRCHDRRQVEVVAYSSTTTADAATRRIAGAVDLWRDVAGRTEAETAAAIRADGVDVLVVLAGHAGSNPLAVAGFRPAPVQVSFHDVSTSGVDAIDAWLTDPILHPADTPELFVETLVRLPSFYLHRPPGEAPVPEPRGVGPIIFGSFNNPLKLGPAVLDAWARILDAVPGTRLLVKYKNRFASPLVQAPVRHALGDRVDFLVRDVSRAEQLGLWNLVDIALDPFPFNGSATSFEALWMGVPVVTLAGDRFVGRVGASLLAQVGLGRLVASDTAGYVDRAVALASDRPALAGLRAGLRDRIAASPLCDAEAYARNVEAAYRDLWRAWCDRR
ncbi:MAG: hypothetical protein EXQ95_07155 [Alphaproteobacteria bacterium]|nr:hypothetical protein [Alphaproteobacteria bacterium]